MTLSRKNRGDEEERTSPFVEQAAVEETAQLHCEIPARLHRRLRILAIEQDTTMKDLVVTAIEEMLASKA